MIKEEEFPLLEEEEYQEEVCECGSGRKKSKERRRLNTMFVDQESNFTPPCCDECFSDVWNYYEERWAEYYSGVMG